DGVVFERAYSNIPQTLPAHAALLTGRLPADTGIRDGVGFTLKSSERLLAEMLTDRGFSTAGIVSSYLLRKETGIDQGFSFFDADLPSSNDGSVFDTLRRDGRASEDIAERWLQSVGTDRAFLFLHLDEPRHAVARAAAGATDDAIHPEYDAAIALVDQIVGRLVRYLRAHQLYDRSTIILVSDHGQGLGDHGEQAHGLFVYDEVLRVPLIVKQPAGEGAGRRVTAVAEIVDIVPTILDLAKAPDPGGLRGRSLKQLIDSDAEAGAPRFAYAESLYGAYHFGWSGLRSVTDGRWRYIAAPRPELYDLVADPAQRQNLADTRPDTVDAMKRALKDFDPAAETLAPTSVAAAGVPAGERERLEVLGYVGTRHGEAAVSVAAASIDAKDTYHVVEQYRAAVIAAASTQPSAGIEQFRALAKAEPDSADVWLHLAAAATRAERYELASDALARADRLEPRNPWTLLGLASTSLKMRKFEDARQHAELAITSPAADPIARGAGHELLARVALARHDEVTARRQARLAEELDPGRPVVAYVEGRIAHEQGRYAAAGEAFGRALSLIGKSNAPMLPDLRYYAGDTLLRLNRPSEAEFLFLEELEAAPYSARTRAGLAALYRATGRTDEAATTLGGH
ncbi:MAG: sulfatase-like hydrolase/transferase, partial [Luteitalea sp.]|nr:sulfatase-like hydrolase/transferase [Luteitalea sp.]